VKFFIYKNKIESHWLGHFYPELESLARGDKVFIEDLVNHELFFEVFPIVLICENPIGISKVLMALNIYLEFIFDLEFGYEPEVDVVSLGFVNLTVKGLENLPTEIVNSGITVLTEKALGRIMGTHIPYLKRQPDKQLHFKEAFLALMDDMQKSGDFASTIDPFTLPTKREGFDVYNDHEELN